MVSPFGSASTVSPLTSCGGVIDQSCGQSAWSAVEVGGGKEAEFGGAGEEESCRRSRPEVAMSVQEEDPSACHCLP